MSQNPFTLKELRQLTRNRVVTGSVLSFLALQFLGCVSLLLPGSLFGKGVPRGQVVFSFLGVLLCSVLFVVIPGNVFFRFLAERAAGKTELAFATPLPPEKIVDGKALAAFLLSLLFVSASFPFLLLTTFLNGVDIVSACFFVALALWGGLIAVYGSLVLGVAWLPRLVKKAAFFLGAFFAAVAGIVLTALSVENMRPQVFLQWFLPGLVVLGVLRGSAAYLLHPKSAGGLSGSAFGCLISLLVIGGILVLVFFAAIMP